MMIEENTNYAYKLKYMDNPTFDKVRELSTKFYRELPQALQNELFEALNRGIDILDSEPQMTAYLFVFGKMHQAKLNYAFDKLPKEFFEQPEINIIDYGCGQALGTMCYADFLREKGYSQKVKAITLIEPSETCLKRAALHASAFFPDAEIMTVNKKFDDLTQDDIVCNEETPTLHVLSNVLDMLNFDLDKFSTLIKDSLNGYSQLVCVGPYFSLSYKDNRMIQFHLLIGGKVEYRKILDKYELDSERAWTVQVLCFSIGNLMTEKLSTDVMAEDLKDAVVDEHGVLYSKDGRRLLKCSDNHPETYNIKDGTKVICNNAFSELWNRGALKQVTIPNSVAIIGNDAFRCCESLRKITLPPSLTTIGDNPFVGCDIVDFENHSKLFTTTDQMLIEIKENRLIAYFGKEESIIIPDSIKCIGGSAFGNCHLLRKIIIPDSVDIICQRAFARCRSLQNIAIPSSVKSIGRWAFDCCDSLKTISITNSVERIGYGAFHGCSSLLRIYIPESVTAIPAEVFEGCESLQYVLIPKSVTSIGVGAFAGCNSLIQIHLPNSVKRIEDEAFDDCESLQQIVIPKGSIEKFKEMLDEELWDKLVEQ
jgi:hypothetical protein